MKKPTTVEFWLTILTNVLAYANIIPIPEHNKWILTLATVAAYSIAQGLRNYDINPAQAPPGTPGTATLMPVALVPTEMPPPAAPPAAPPPPALVSP